MHCRRRNTKEKAKVVADVWGMEFIQFLAALAILHQDVKKRRNIITATWRNGCFEKMKALSVHTTLNHHPTVKWMFSQKLFFKSFFLLNG